LHLGNENWFWYLLTPFLAGVVYAFYSLWRDRRDLETLGYQNLVLQPGVVWGRRALKGLLLLGGLFLVLLGTLRLQGKPVPEDLNLRGIDLMIVLDVSKSMLTQDMIPNRLEAAKKSVLNWLQNREGDRAGLVVFAGEALLQVPLTLDLEAVSLVLDRDDVDVVDRGGTDIGQGIQTALAAFPKEEQGKRGRAILLITDGEITDGASNVTQACLAAKQMKVPILAVGIGTRQGRPIPDGVSFWGEAQYKRRSSGDIVVSRLDEKMLAKIADVSEGLFITADSDQGLAGIGKGLENLQKSEMKGKGAMRREELAPSLGLFATGALLLSTLI